MKYTPDKGQNIYSAAKDAISLSRKHHEEVELEFNGIIVLVWPASFAVDIATIYDLKHELRRAALPTSP